NRSSRPVRFLLACGFLVQQWWRNIVKDFLRLRPFASWREYKQHRGMSPWYDVVDWVGGYPFEVAKPEGIFDFYHLRGFTLTKMTTCGGTLPAMSWCSGRLVSPRLIRIFSSPFPRACRV